MYAAAVAMLIAGATMAPSESIALSRGRRRTHRPRSSHHPAVGLHDLSGHKEPGGIDVMAFFEQNNGDEGDEGYARHKPDEQDESVEPGDEAHHGPQPLGNIFDKDGNEDHKDGSYSISHGTAYSSAACHSSSDAYSSTVEAVGHADAMEASIAWMCTPHFSGSISHPLDVAFTAGVAIANAVAYSQADCVSSGNAFGCASASAHARAWAWGHFEFHVNATTRAIKLCPCLASNRGASERLASASTFVELMSEAFARAEVVACVAGKDSAWAAAYANCAALAYAQLWTKVGDV